MIKMLLSNFKSSRLLPVLMAGAFIFSSCSRESLQVQKWNGLESQQAYAPAKAPVNNVQMAVQPATTADNDAAMTESKVLPRSGTMAITPKFGKLNEKATALAGKIAEKKLLKQIATPSPAFAKAGKKLQGGHEISAVSGNLRLAIIFIIVGLILTLLSGVPVVGLIFLILGVVLLIVGLIFLLMWLLNEAG